MGDQVRVGDLDIWTEQAGEGPDVLLIGGLGDTVESWQFQLDGLADRYHLIAFDNRGAGRTAMPEKSAKVEVMADDAAGLLQALGISSAHVAGFSMGSAIAQELALRHPELVQSLVLESTYARPDALFRSQLNFWRWLPEVAPSERAFFEAFFTWVYTPRAHADGSVEQIVEEALAFAHPQSVEAFQAQVAVCLAHDTSNRLSEIAAPTLVMAGELDTILPPRFGRGVAEGIPGAQFEVLSGESHQPFQDAWFRPYCYPTVDMACVALTARCSDSEPMRTWSHERLLGRPTAEDSLLGRRRDVQGSGGPHLLREPLLCKAIRGQGQQGRIPCSEEELRIRPEAGRGSHQALGGGPKRAPLCHPPRSLRLRGAHERALRESLHHVPCYRPDRHHQEKGGRSATERDEFLRAAWRVTVAAAVEPERLVFVDECGTHTSLGPIYGYAPRGERLHLRVPRKRGKNTTLLASMTIEGMGPSLVVEGATTARVFEAYVEKVLAPSLKEGQIALMDNLGAHRPKRVRELIEERGAELLYLPSYSRDYNPIEEAFAKVKNLLRNAAARTKGALVEAIGVALSAVSAQDARGYFEHAGYLSPAHLL